MSRDMIIPPVEDATKRQAALNIVWLMRKQGKHDIREVLESLGLAPYTKDKE